VKNKPEQSIMELREALDKRVPEIDLSLSELIKNMRQITNKTQIEYAKLIGVAPRIIIDLENGKGNPTLSTLNKMARPFGYEVSFSKMKR
jgi:DNA-binding XRE family transcriptional regulator